MVMKRIKWFLHLIGLSFIHFGCSSDFKDPEKVMRAYYQSNFTDKDFKKGYKYLSSESQKRTSLDEYQKYFADSKHRKITNLSLLPEDREKTYL